MKRHVNKLSKWSIVLAFSAVFLSAIPAAGQQEKIASVMQQMFTAIDKLQTMSFHIQLRERLRNDTYNYTTQDVNVMLVPKFKCHLYMQGDNAGAELLFASDEFKNKAIYSKGILKLKLDPRGKKVREDKHHTIFDLGFSYIGNILKAYFKEDASSFKYHGDITWDGVECYSMELSSDVYKIQDYTTEWGDDIVSIARKNNVSEYKILELNEHIKEDYKDLKPYQQIKITNYYARQLIFYVDKKTNLPIYQKIVDEKGVFEEYEYHDMKVNFKFPEKEFSADHLGE
jgi:outer membrane lipoprotein-sorting protein